MMWNQVFRSFCFDFIFCASEILFLRKLEGTAKRKPTKKVSEKRLTLAPQRSRTLKALFIIHSIEWVLRCLHCRTHIINNSSWLFSTSEIYFFFFFNAAVDSWSLKASFILRCSKLFNNHFQANFKVQIPLDNIMKPIH